MEEIRTGVDELMALLKEGTRLSVPDAAKQLKESEATIQNWVDFLVEEKLVGIEYKFTTPFVYRNAPQQRVVLAQKVETMEDIRSQFIAHAKEKGIPKEKLGELWEHHLLSEIQLKQQFFREECTRRSLLNVDALLARYTERIVNEYGLRHLA